MQRINFIRNIMEQEKSFQPTYKVLPPTEKSKEMSLLKSDEEKSIKLK